MIKNSLLFVLLIIGVTIYAHADPMNRDGNNVQLTEGIRNVLKTDIALGSSLTDIQLKAASDGTVYLRGTVNTMAERDAIGAKVGNYPGVTQVNNDIKVKNL